MTLRIYNTMSRKKEVFKPRHKDKVEMFVCGPTVYDHSHIGHAKSYVQFDMIARYLGYKGYKLFYLQNITDIDDKIINRANETKQDPKKVAEEFTKSYYEDMEALNVKSINQYANATDFIPQIISQIKRLFERGYAYEIDDGIYYDISKFKEYGKLSHQNLDELKVRRVEPNPQKRNPGDFSLWKKQKPGEPYWQSPWGKGRPGWHIEDTAITETVFGPQYDIHGGGIDLIFPHHESEIAQIEAVSGKKPLVRYWMHNGFLKVKGEKMSKSLGNFITIKDALKKWDAMALRYFFISSHYMAPINFTEKALDGAKNSVERFNDFIIKLREVKDGKQNKDVQKLIKDVKTKFEKAVDDDFNLSDALGNIFEFMRQINKLIVKNQISKADAQKVLETMMGLDSVLGVMKFEEEELDKEIKLLVEKREQARKDKNFELADKIRKDLKNSGIILEDTPQGVRWKKI